MSVFNKGKFVCDRAMAEIFFRPEQKACDYGAWIFLLSQAAFQDHMINYHGRFIEIKRGQYPTTYRNLASRFNWCLSRTQRFINNAKKAGYISTSAGTGFLIITICNYNEIQDLNCKSDTVSNTNKHTVTDIKTGNNRTKETKKRNKEGGEVA